MACLTTAGMASEAIGMPLNAVVWMLRSRCFGGEASEAILQSQCLNLSFSLNALRCPKMFYRLSFEFEVRKSTCGNCLFY